MLKKLNTTSNNMNSRRGSSGGGNFQRGNEAAVSRRQVSSPSREDSVITETRDRNSPRWIITHHQGIYK